MKKYKISYTKTEVWNGYCEIEADSLEEAEEKFEDADYDLLDEEMGDSWEEIDDIDEIE